ncbi:glycosyl transferase family 2 [Halothece sp. PCC 7418]|nr:glycosyl transferase family 2 [Halothece sp. PCC 7418]
MEKTRNNGALDNSKSDATEQMLHKLIELNPEIASAHANLGRHYAQQGDLEKAVACYEKALRLQPNDATKRSLDRAKTKLEQQVNNKKNNTEQKETIQLSEHSSSTTFQESEKASFFGRLDNFKDNQLTGWLINQENLDQNCQIDIFINGIFYRRVLANRWRDDLYKNFGTGNHGFLIEIPYLPKSLQSLEITASVAEYPNCLIGRGPKAKPIIIKNFQGLPGWKSGFPLANQLPLPKNNREKIEYLSRDIAIIIPIYNAREEVLNCIASVLKHTKRQFKLILIDDGSTDTKLISTLRDYDTKFPEITLHQNRRNLGYTPSINKGIAIAGEADVVLLNSDTIVTPRWLDNLQVAAYSAADISTVTALSNNAGAFSVPKDRKVNSIPSWLDEESFARLVTQESLALYPEIPTGNGFCLYIRRDALNNLGFFDEEAFPRGYGEENDFCLRALTRGWRNIIDDRTLVYHIRSASFGEHKAELVKSGRKIIDQRYPEYAKAVRNAFTDSPLMATLRFNLEQSLHHYTRFSLPRILYVISSESGGTPQTNIDLMNQVTETYQPFLLTSDTKTLKLYDCRGQEKILSEEFHLSIPLTGSTHESAEYNRFVEYILIRYGIELLHIRHIGRHSLSLPRIAKKLNISVIFSFHDFYTITPNVKLLDYREKYCFDEFSTDQARSNVELWSPESCPRLTRNWRKRWQQRMLGMLQFCDSFVTTSQKARQILQSTFPFLSNRDFRVIPHGRDFQKMLQLGQIPSPNEPIRILIPGHLCISKGSLLIKEIKACDRENKLEFHFLGSPDSSLDDIGVQHGKYKRSDFLEIVANINPHMGAIFSIWPETYSHTLTEMWATDLPVIALPMGAVEERLQKHGAGWIVENVKPAQVYKEITEVFSNPKEYTEKLDRVLAWQKGEGSNYTTKAMARQYIDLYESIEQNNKESLLAEQQQFSTPAKQSQQIIELFIDEQELKLPHSRKALRQWLLENKTNIEFTWQKCTVDAFLAGNTAFNCSSGDLVILSIHDIIPDKLEQLIAQCNRIELSFIGLLEQHKVTTSSKEAGSKDHFDAGIEQELKNILSKADAILMIGTTVWVDQIRQYFRDKVSNIWKYSMDSNSSWTDTAQRLVIHGNDRINWLEAMKKAQGRKVNHVSIVIPVYGKQDLTHQCINSIFRSTSSDISFDVLIMDNGSPDNTASMVTDMQQTYPNLKLFSSKQNLMFSLGCNIGVIASTGEYIVLLNNDTVVSKNWLSSLIEPLQKKSNVGITGPKLIYPDHTLQAGGIVFSNQSKFPYHIYKNMSENNQVVNKQRYFQALTGACLAMRAVDFLAVKGLDPCFVNGSEDLDLCFKVRTQLRKKLLYCPNSTITHFEGKTPGRGGHRLQNRKIFVDRWRKQIQADDLSFYDEDGFQVEQYLPEKGEVIGDELASIKPKLSRNENL